MLLKQYMNSMMMIPCLNPFQDCHKPRAMEIALVAGGPALLTVVNWLIVVI